MFKLHKFNIDFDVTQKTPYFQVDTKHRIRFGMENLNMLQLKDILGTTFNEDQDINLIFVSEYIVNHVRRSSKTNLSKYLTIRNWKEKVVHDERSGGGVVYTRINHLNLDEVIKYCVQLYKGKTQAYIAFYNDNFLMYISTDVIDIISDDSEKMKELKEKYYETYNKYHDE
jgi:trehalose utilization protein